MSLYKPCTFSYYVHSLPWILQKLRISVNTSRKPCSAPGGHFCVYGSPTPFPHFRLSRPRAEASLNNYASKVILGFPPPAADPAYLLWAVHHCCRKKWSLESSSLCGLDSFPAFSQCNPSSSQWKTNFHCCEEIIISVFTMPLTSMCYGNFLSHILPCLVAKATVL